MHRNMLIGLCEYVYIAITIDSPPLHTHHTHTGGKMKMDKSAVLSLLTAIKKPVKEITTAPHTATTATVDSKAEVVEMIDGELFVCVCVCVCMCVCNHHCC